MPYPAENIGMVITLLQPKFHALGILSQRCAAAGSIIVHFIKITINKTQ